jgi:hypothetical protein
VTAPALSKFQGYEIQRIARSQIQNASYNPRRISAGNRERLAHGLQRHKLVMPPVWNKRTGNLVSGHQRLSILDEKHKGADYLLDVAAIDVPEKKEVQINILLNNESAMGEFDNQAVQLLAQEFEFDLSDAGFSREDLYINFDLEKPIAPEKSTEEKTKIRDRRDIEKQEYRDEKAAGLTHDSEAKQDYMISLVFPTNMAAQEFLASYGLDATKRIFPHDLFMGAVGG